MRTTRCRALRRIWLALLVPVTAYGTAAASDETPGVAVAAEVLEARKVQWDDVADRCPGGRPARSLAPGYLVTMTLDGEVYQFFVNGGQTRMCGPKQEPAGAGAVADGALGALAEDARKDLAIRLQIPIHRIRIHTAERVTWRDSSIGCPRPGRLYAQALTEGARVFLAVGDRKYRYHQAGKASPFLCETPSDLEPLPAHEIR